MEASAQHQSRHDDQSRSRPPQAREEDIESEQDEDAVGSAEELLQDDEMRRPLHERGFTAIERQYNVMPKSMPKRIHILGTGSIGKLVAHSLRSLPDPPPVSLIFHRRRLIEAWKESSKEITINRNGADIKQSGFEVELAHEVQRRHGAIVKQEEERHFEGETPPHIVAEALTAQQTDLGTLVPERRDSHVYKAQRDDVIHHLVVTVKAYLTVPALLRIRYRLRSSSTICLLQNGMGVIDELNEKVFPDPATRPKYIQGIVTHGVNVPPEIAQHDPFYAVHAGQGTIALGLVSPEPMAKPHYSRYLLRTLTRSPVLVAVTHTPTELLQLQLEKLAVNSILNPLTVLMDARNGCILNNFHITRTMRLLLAETSLVIRSLPELRGLANVANRFSATRLETIVMSVASGTAQNISSMLADVRAGRQTEVEYINGYIVRKGEELGIKCVVNYGIMNTVLGKSKMVAVEIRSEIPTDADLNTGL